MDNLLNRVNNNLLQEGTTSNQYLRRQELRRQMSDGTYDADQTNQASQPTTNVLSQPTLAQTYSSLLNNYQNYTSQLSDQGSQPSSYRSIGNGGTLNIPSWLPAGVSMAGALTGNSLYGTLASNAMKIAGGNVEGGIGGLSGLFSSMLSGGKLPSGVVSSGVSGLLSGRDPSEIGKDMANSGIGYGLGMVNPVLGGVYGLARLFGFDPMYGMNNQFGNGMEGVAPGFGGTAGGFFGKNAIGSGINATSSNTPNSLYNPTPAGYTQGDLGTGLSTGAGLGFKGSLNSGSYSSSSSGWGTNAGYSTSGNSNYSPYGGSSYTNSSDSGDS